MYSKKKAHLFYYLVLEFIQKINKKQKRIGKYFEHLKAFKYL